MMKRILLILFLLFPLLTGFAQGYPRGAILDSEKYAQAPRKAALVSRSYDTLPSSFSLRSYAPSPGDQNPYGTCVAWATAYAARTIMESVALSRNNKTLTNQNVFSPAFVYKNISSDPLYSTGISQIDALNLMKTRGVPKMSQLERVLGFAKVLLSSYANERTYTIQDYAVLLPYGEYLDKGEWNPGKLPVIKKALTEKKPVLISILCPPSFDEAENVWYPPESPNMNEGGHALCVTGYDDAKYGGAFEVLNSWGDGWGTGGYIWIPYSVFLKFTMQAFELADNLFTYGSPVVFSGYANIQVRNSAGMPVTYRDGYYETTGAWPSGTRFRYLLGNKEPAYVYAFASDSSTGRTNMIFPHEGGVSPLLNYFENEVAFPGEDKWIELDAVPGMDYLIVLYSKKPLDIGGIKKTFESARGSFPDRVAQAVGPRYLAKDRTSYSNDKLQFFAQTTDTDAVLGLLLAIKHSAGN